MEVNFSSRIVYTTKEYVASAHSGHFLTELALAWGMKDQYFLTFISLLLGKREASQPS